MGRIFNAIKLNVIQCAIGFVGAEDKVAVLVVLAEEHLDLQIAKVCPVNKESFLLATRSHITFCRVIGFWKLSGWMCTEPNQIVAWIRHQKE